MAKLNIEIKSQQKTPLEATISITIEDLPIGRINELQELENMCKAKLSDYTNLFYGVPSDRFGSGELFKPHNNNL